MIRLYDTLKFDYTINKTVDLSSKTMTLDAAKDLLRHTGTVSGQTISFSNDVWAMILDNEEAVDLLEAAYAKGWGSNEPDITVIANSGYDGVVRVNAANKQLTQVGSTGVWIGSAGTVTALDYFLKHDSRSNYNSTSVNVKKVRFGKNINTASCTTLQRLCCSNNSDVSVFDTIDVTHLNTSSVTNMQETFANIAKTTADDTNRAKEIKLKGFENFNTSNVTTFSAMFASLFLNNAIIDLSKWHIKSGATITNMFGALSTQRFGGTNTCFYYTPGYWAKDPMNDSNLAADRVKPTVYPYHDITVAASSGFGGTCAINETSVNMSQDSTLGIWYYDVPSGTTVSSFKEMFNSNSYIISASFKDSIYSKLSNDLNLYRIFRSCTGLKSVDISAIASKIYQYGQFASNSTNLSNIYGFENLSNKDVISDYIVQGNTAIRYLNVGSDIATSNIAGFANNASNLIRLHYLPGIANAVSTVYAFNGCSSLTTIDASGNIAETIDFSSCPLTLASAKVILNALQTVTAETLTFSSTTKGYINADSEALALVAAARNKGWTIAL